MTTNDDNPDRPRCYRLVKERGSADGTDGSIAPQLPQRAIEVADTWRYESNLACREILLARLVMKLGPAVMALVSVELQEAIAAGKLNGMVLADAVKYVGKMASNARKRELKMTAKRVLCEGEKARNNPAIDLSDAFASASRHETRVLIARALRLLPRQYREALWRRFLSEGRERDHLRFLEARRASRSRVRPALQKLAAIVAQLRSQLRGTA